MQAFGYEWRTSQPWGRYHPDNSKAWYSDECVNIRGSKLELSTHYHCKEFEGTTRPMACGLISSKYKDFGYGEYEIVAKLPRGKQLWSAFWFAPIGEAPPEIDVFEAETRKTKGYFNIDISQPQAFWLIKSNAHYGENYDEDHQELGAKRSFMGFKSPSFNYISYKFIWTVDAIKIYYNNIPHRFIRNESILQAFRGKKITIIINNIVSDKFKDFDKTSKMMIKSFTYKPY